MGKVEAATYEAGVKPDLRERLMALAGQSTWREPVGGYGGVQRGVPAMHQLAGLLAMSRNGRGDIGPDVAIDMATGRMANMQKVCEALGAALASDRSVLMKRNAPYIAVIASAGYYALVIGHRAVKPDGVDGADWELLTKAAEGVLATLVDETIQRAKRNMRRSA
jgi:hypothetical protein